MDMQGWIPVMARKSFQVLDVNLESWSDTISQGLPWRRHISYANIRARSSAVFLSSSVTPDTLVYTFNHSRSRGIGGTNHRDNQEDAAPSMATPPASARGAAVVDTKRPPLAERNHPRAVTILQSPNGSNND